jgi:ferric-dicitrate binding protein FerR (iron transport regulator)
MSQKFQEAVAAARAGEKETAQHLLIDILEENPDETQAWFLLSHLVDAEEKQATYLKKVVALDPTHAKARQRLGQLRAKQAAAEIPTDPPALPISTDPFDFDAQAEGDTLPEWMADEEMPVTTAVLADEATAAEEMEIPDWLKTSLDEDEAEESGAETVEPTDAEAIAAARQAAKSKPAPTAAPDPDAVAEEAARLNQILAILVALAILIAAIMGYLIFFQ